MKLFGLTLLAFAVRLQLFLSSDEPTGWDGYSYVVQVERLVTEGRLHWPDASWVTYFFGALHFVMPSIVAVKVGACVLAALVVPAAWKFGQTLGPSHAWLLACWAAASPTLTHLAGDFAKNLGVVAPLLVVLAWRKSPSPPRGERVGERGSQLLLLAAAALIAALAHRLGAALLVAVALGAGIGALLSKWSDRRVVLVALALVLAFIALSAALPNLLHPADLDRLQGQVTFRPGLPPPLPYFALRETSWPQRLELLLAWPALAFGCWRFLRQRDQRVVVGALLVPLMVCVFPLWRTDSLDVGYRLMLMAPVFALPLLLPLSPTHFLPNAVAPRGFGPWAERGIILAVLLARTGFDPQATPPYSQWRALISRIPRPLPTLLIAPQGLNFLYDHETGRESLAWSPEPELERANIYRLAWNVSDGDWSTLGTGLTPPPTRLSAEVLYVREDVWEQFLQRARTDADEALLEKLADWRNPSRVRPRSLQRNH